MTLDQNTGSFGAREEYRRTQAPEESLQLGTFWKKQDSCHWYQHSEHERICIKNGVIYLKSVQCQQ